MNLPIERGELRQLASGYVVPIALALVSFVCICTAFVLLIQFAKPHQPIEIVLGESTPSGTIQKGEITVDIGGGVVHPGVYRIPAGSRMDDAIQRAGGLSGEVSSELLEKAINRAQKLNDGAKIYIPKKDEIGTSHNNIKVDTKEPMTSHNISNEKAEGNHVSINSATQSELESISGVGPATAQKIIQNRPYVNLEELVTKKAVGQKLFEKIKQNLSL